MEYFKWMYGTHSDIYIQANKELELYRSAQGVRQGDMPASLLFSLVFTDAAIAADVDGAALTSLWLYLTQCPLSSHTRSASSSSSRSSISLST